MSLVGTIQDNEEVYQKDDGTSVNISSIKTEDVSPNTVQQVQK